MNCRDCRERLDWYLDRELSERELEEVRRHLEDCPPCEDDYQLQVGLKRLVRLSCEKAPVPPHLREKLNQILS